MKIKSKLVYIPVDSNTEFPEQEFEDSCIRNTQQWLTQFKKNIKL